MSPDSWPCRRGGLGEEKPEVASLARPRAFQSNGQRQSPACLPQRPGILLPGIAIEINRQQPTGFVREHRIEAHDKVAAQVVPAREVLANDVIGDGQEAPVRTFEALDTGLVAQAADPFVGAGRLVAAPASLAALEAAGINVLASTE